MIKKLVAWILAAVMPVLLAACALDYYTTITDGDFHYAVSKWDAFVYEYNWDGDAEHMDIVIPDKVDVREVVAVGGFFGRGLPMPFQVDISAAVAECEGEWLPGGTEVEADETVEMRFTFRYPVTVKKLTDYGESESYFRDENGKVTKFIVYKAFVMKEGKDHE